jgi:hypothetical protein
LEASTLYFYLMETVKLGQIPVDFTHSLHG